MAEADRSNWRALAWACYLACSWTWCIGMFLPVLLLRDYGAWGFVVFAVPNVVGAAAFGWVLGRPGAGAALRDRHIDALRTFGLVTLAFHGFFVAWVARSLTNGPDATGVTVSSVFSLGVLLLPVLAAAGFGHLLDASWWRRVSVWVMLLSVLLGAAFWFDGAAVVEAASTARTDLDAARRPETALLWVAPVTIFGFALCPYLDLTFHRARTSLDERGARLAFTVGFGVLFLLMILFTAAYTGVFLWGAGGLAIVLVQFAVQATFTCAVHARELGAGSRRGEGTRPIGAFVAVAVGMLAGLMVGGSVFDLQTPQVRMDSGELAYRLFMGAYGLVFPAYVWLLMIPTSDGHSGPGGAAGRTKMRIYWLAVGIAMPMFWLGFMERREFWLAPGLMVVLAARFVLPRARSTRGAGLPANGARRPERTREGSHG